LKPIACLVQCLQGHGNELLVCRMLGACWARGRFDVPPSETLGAASWPRRLAITTSRTVSCARSACRCAPHRAARLRATKPEPCGGPHCARTWPAGRCCAKSTGKLGRPTHRYGPGGSAHAPRTDWRRPKEQNTTPRGILTGESYQDGLRNWRVDK